jgi:glucosamine--fructose-6-phosphate aminotransferase (isomerizing)
MCGIVGGAKKDNIADFIIDVLRKIEYRGYDSWGLAIASSHRLEVKKEVGAIDSFSGSIDFKGSVGIGHTRWATHGGVTRKNAHPHLSSDGKIAIVHNGIIENFQELRDELKHEGYDFISETDSEVIVHLIDKNYTKHGSLVDSCQVAAERLNGSYAVGVVSSHEPDKVIVMRNISPLRIGIGNDGLFFTSDIVALLGNATMSISLENGDIAELTKDEISIYHDGLRVQRDPEEIKWDKNGASKNRFNHFMLKEIYEQEEKVKEARLQDKSKLERIVHTLKDKDNIFLIGSGSSYHAAGIIEHKFAKLGIPVQAKQSSEFGYLKSRVSKNTGIIAISQSGETADLLDALSTVKDKNPYILSICNRPGSSLIRESNDVLYTNSGPEIAVAATKSYTGQLAVLDLICSAFEE